jgi:hypothetical protein
MPVMADHDAARDFAGLVNGDKHVRAGTGFGETEVGYGVIVRYDEIAGAPQRDNGLFIFGNRTFHGEQH